MLSFARAQVVRRHLRVKWTMQKKTNENILRHHVLYIQTIVHDGFFAWRNTALPVSAASSPRLQEQPLLAILVPFGAVGETCLDALILLWVVEDDMSGPAGKKGGSTLDLTYHSCHTRARPRNHSRVPSSPHRRSSSWDRSTAAQDDGCSTDLGTAVRIELRLADKLA